MAGRRLALIVATDEYLDPGLRQLRAPAKDAEALARVLADPELGDFEVDVVRNGTSYAIAERVETLLSGSKTSDLVVIHFSCHGLKDDSGELYLAATNTRPGLLASTAVDASVVNRLMRRSRSQRVVLFLDCCYGGAFERGVVSRAAGVIDVADQFIRSEDELGGGRGRVVITASNAMEFAFEGADLSDSIASQPSVFTGALVEGLTTGAADRDQDGMVALGELYDYVFERVRAESPNQTPGKWEFGLQGELYLAKNPQRVIVPVPLPPDILALVDHPFPPTRLGSIEVVTRLAEGANLPLAAGAREVLERLASDDSRAVATAAQDALAKVTLRVSASTLDLGRVAIGAEAAGLIVMDGVPLALASRIETSGPKLQTRRADRTIRVVADTSEPGVIDGVVRIIGPAGNAEVRVTGVVGDGPIEVAEKTTFVRDAVNTTAAAPEIDPAGAATPVVVSSLPARMDAEVVVPAEPPAVRPAAVGPSRDIGHTARRLLQRGWRTGHVQTLIGAEIGALGVMSLAPAANLGSVPGFYGWQASDVIQLAYVLIWAGAVVAVAITLALTGPSTLRKNLFTLVVLIVLYPVFRVVLNGRVIYPNFEVTLETAIVVALLALIASTVPRLTRPRPT